MTKLAEHITRKNLLPGSDLGGLDVSPSTLFRYRDLGWVEYRGRWILTKLGYEQN